MPEISDIELMQFADGTLEPAAQQTIESELERSPALRGRLDAFLTTGKALAQLFEPVVMAPIPERLTETVLQASAVPSADALRRAPPRQPGGLRALLQANLLPLLRRPSSALAIAGLCAVVAGTAVMWLARPDSLVGPAPEAMARALETTPSWNRSRFTLAVRGSASLEPILTFAHKDGRHCRQYELAFGSGRGFVGFACRIGQGAWRIEQDAVAVMYHDDRSKTVRPADRIQVPEIEEAIDKVAASDPLEMERERDLINRGWRPDTPTPRDAWQSLPKLPTRP